MGKLYQIKSKLDWKIRFKNQLLYLSSRISLNSILEFAIKEKKLHQEEELSLKLVYQPFV